MDREIWVNGRQLQPKPVDDHENKFVITNDEAYFLPYLNRDDAPTMAEILGEIFDLDDPQVHRDVDGRLFGGRIILGYFEPATKEVVIHVPLETSGYVEERIKEVFGSE